MNDVIRTLKRFTACSDLDRDALVFAAGQASAQSDLRLVWIAAMLVASQLVTLMAFFR
jgi:hypothetical protein